MAQPYSTPQLDNPPSFVGINIPETSPGLPAPQQGYPYSHHKRGLPEGYPMAYSPGISQSPVTTSSYQVPPVSNAYASYSPSLPSYHAYSSPLMPSQSPVYSPSRRQQGTLAGAEASHHQSPHPLVVHQASPATPYGAETASPKHAFSPHQIPDNFQRPASYSPSHYALQQATQGNPTHSPIHHHHHQQQQHNFYGVASPRLGPPLRPHSASPVVTEGFKIVRDAKDLRPLVNAQPMGRRADTSGNGSSLSPLKALTTNLTQTYHIVNPAFRYELAFNPRRVLTKPSKPAGNDGHDNDDSDYILYVNDLLGSDEGHKYIILDVLGQGTFGQVVKCQNIKTHEIVAVKVVKNKPAYFNQSMMEVTILEMLNNTWDAEDRHHILRLKDTFIHHSHLCLVFELLSSNLYELIKQNSFRGLSTSLVRVFTAQLLDSLAVLNDARLIHCDLKPENILLKTLQSPTIKIIDFGSACHERQTVYTYIQSRFYRSPEVLLGLPYTSAIDMWSLGCICVELFLGLPLFPGTSEYNQLSRIVEMLGTPPTYMIEVGKQAGHFFEPAYDQYGGKTFRLKTLEQYSRERNVQEQPSKKYFTATTLHDIIKTYPMPRKGQKPVDAEKEMTNRIAFIDFVQGLLNMNPHERWSPQQARLHPFILGEPLRRPFVPPSNVRGPPIGHAPTTPSSPTSSKQRSNSEKHAYGGLPNQSQRTPQRIYQDAASYNAHLAQQQVYNTASQYRSQQSNNPYAQAQVPVVPPPPPSINVPTNPPPVHHGQPPRHRSRTIGQMDAVPPQLAKLGFDLSSIPGQSVTPVLRRDDQRAAWEQRDPSSLNRRASITRHNPGLDFLTEQAERQWQLPPPPQPAAAVTYAFDAFDPRGEQPLLPYVPMQPARAPAYHSPNIGGMPSPSTAATLQQQQQQALQQQIAYNQLRNGKEMEFWAP